MMCCVMSPSLLLEQGCTILSLQTRLILPSSHVSPSLLLTLSHSSMHKNTPGDSVSGLHHRCANPADHPLLARAVEVHRHHGGASIADHRGLGSRGGVARGKVRAILFVFCVVLMRLLMSTLFSITHHSMLFLQQGGRAGPTAGAAAAGNRP
jgi:hypothetical protein